jgi:Domain of unknown function (DUF4431)
VSLTRYIALFAILPGLAEAAPCVRYGMHTVSGTIERIMFYGPPNFGEDPKTDEKGFYPVLKLDHGLPMCAEGSDGFANGSVTARKMQMIFIGSNKFRKSWYGKSVEVDGDMFAAQTGWHHTPVMLQVKNIRMMP